MLSNTAVPIAQNEQGLPCFISILSTHCAAEFVRHQYCLGGESDFCFWVMMKLYGGWETAVVDFLHPSVSQPS